MVTKRVAGPYVQPPIWDLKQAISNKSVVVRFDVNDQGCIFLSASHKKILSLSAK